LSDARAQILGRIRSALADVPSSERAADVPVARDYRRSDERPRAELVTLFAQRMSDYRARVQRVSADALREAITHACSEQGLHTLAVPTGLPDAWLPAGVELVRDDGLRAAELDRIDGALTGCAAAIAETGTLVLDGGDRSGRRMITLVPDHHICIVESAQIAAHVPEAVAAVRDSVVERRSPITLVSGPSASSDIELSRVEGVHGPRHLLVLILEVA